MGNKRKLKTKNGDEAGEAPVPEKQQKNTPDSEEESELIEPSKQEIEESFKPENTINVQTVRDKKKGVHKKIQEQKKVKCDVQEVEAVKGYLNKWKDDRDNWKFVKRLQIFIQNYCFDPSKILDDDWPACLEYLEGSKGRSREALIAAAEKLISELDNSTEQDDVTKIRYTRSRDLLQMLS